MYTWFFMIKNSAGYPMKVYLQAPDAFRALEQARALYGANLLTEAANLA